MMKNSKGFTLLELIVGISIFAVLAAAALGFLVVSSKTYGSVSTNMSLRMDAQLAVNQISEYLIDCNSGVSWSNIGDEATLCVFCTDDGVTCAHSFRFDKADGKLYYDDSRAEHLLVDHVSAFNVALVSGNGEGVDYAEITLELNKRGKRHTEWQTIALRNKPLLKDS